MNHRLHLRFEQLERATQQLLHEAEQLGERAYTAPAAGQWSAAQVVQHLLRSEQLTTEYIQTRLQQEAQPYRTGVRGRLRALLLRLALRLPGLKFKAPGRTPSIVPAEAAAVPPLAELRQQWAASRRQLEQLLNEFPGRLLTHAILKHPRAGQLTIGQALDFLLDHVLHHRQQLNRISKTLGAAPAPVA